MKQNTALAILAIIALFIATTGTVFADGNTGETACTPVYGMANTCIEHQVVDTGAADSILYTLSAASYLAGLAALIKAKVVA